MELRKKFLIQLILALPLLVVSYFSNRLIEMFISQPWQAGCILIPLLILTVWLIMKEGKKDFKLSRKFLIFFLIYVVLFSIAAGNSLFDFKRTLIGYGEHVPRNWFSLNRLGDWRYLICPRNKERSNLLVITFEADQTIETARWDMENLIRLAVDQRAKGIAFDFYFRTSSPIDPLLTRRVLDARQNNFPVFAGYGFKIIEDDEIRRDLIPESLEACFPEESLGHLVGYAQSDNMIRIIPLYFQGDRDYEALSLKVARILNNEIKAPSNGLLQYVKPDKNFKIYKYSEIKEERKKWPLLRDRFLLVGEGLDEDTFYENSRPDIFSTPFGNKLGVILHAYVIHSLVHGHYIRRMPFWPTLILVYFFCYWLMVFVHKGTSLWKLLGLCGLTSLGIIILSVIAILSSLVWLDIIYFLTALWLFLPILLLLRKKK